MADAECHFRTTDGSPHPFPPTAMVPPAIGSLLYVAGAPATWRVTDVRYQFAKPSLVGECSCEFGSSDVHHPDCSYNSPTQPRYEMVIVVLRPVVRGSQEVT